MSRRVAGLGLLAALPLLLVGCYREERSFQAPGPAASAPDPVRIGSIVPGAASNVQPGVTAASQAANYEENAFAVNQGKRLFRWYNCNGCHGQGGGGMGVALMDDQWLYGSAPANVFTTIMQGRPNGMPSFGGRIPEDQVWQLVAYVRSLSGQLRKDVATSRSDGLAGAPPENTRAQERPRPAPPASGAGN
jgi:cytochrome c oxidase cbb3-type subunit 3